MRWLWDDLSFNHLIFNILYKKKTQKKSKIKIKKFFDFVGDQIFCLAFQAKKIAFSLNCIYIYIFYICYLYRRLHKDL